MVNVAIKNVAMKNVAMKNVATKNVIEALNWRYAVRKFSSDVISEKQLEALLTATRLSASSYGLQPYRLLVVKSAEVRKELLKYSMGQDKVLNSSHLIVFAAQTNIGDWIVDDYVNKVSRVRSIPIEELQNMSDHFKSALAVKSEQQKKEWAQNQTYLAVGNFLTCAAMMKIDTCPMGGFEVEGYDKVLGLAEKGLTTAVICPIGKRHSDDSLAGLPKVRFDAEEMIFTV